MKKRLKKRENNAQEKQSVSRLELKVSDNGIKASDKTSKIFNKK